MPTSLDLNLVPLARHAGQDLTDLPGLYVSEPPRRPARSRSSDRLILYLTLGGNAPLSPGKQEQILAHLAKTFYETSGSVTAALRSVAEGLNQFLLDRNVQNASTGRQAVGLFAALALRGDQLYLAFSGPLHAFIISAERSEHLHDPQLSGRGLGLSRTTPVYYFQTGLQVNDTVLLSSQPSPTWTANTLSGLHGQGSDSLRRRLFNRAALDLNAILLQARPGRGQVHLLHPKPLPSTPQTQAGEGEPETDLPIARPQEGLPVVEPPQPPPAPGVSEPLEPQPGEESASPAVGPSPSQGVPSDLPPWEEPQSVPAFKADSTNNPAPGFSAPVVASPAVSQAETVQPAGAAIAAGATAAARSARPARQSSAMSPVWDAFAALGAPLVAAGRGFGRATRALLLRLLPGESFASVPASLMATIAIITPVIVVAIATVIYFELGRGSQYEVAYARAQQMAAQAAAQSELGVKRQELDATLSLIEQARTYGRSPELDDLQRHVRNSLDDLDLVRRVNYQPAVIGGLEDPVQVTRMVISDNDLYMLDGTSGNVIRGRVTSRGYEIDRAFQCGPEIAGITRPLIDIAAWPVGFTPEAAIIAMDADGTVVYCAPGKTPEPAKLTPPPSLQLSDLKGFTLFQSDLYVLDPVGNAVWIYWNSDLAEPPQFFFGEVIPPLADVIDLAVNNDELYLLHSDGHLTLCYYSGLGVAPTRCDDPVPYIDFRPSRENTAMAPPHPFSQLLASTPPDPSLFFLEPRSQSIYHFSLRNLAFQRQYLPLESLVSGDATAFTVNPIERTFYLAIGNNVYYGTIP